ncbi:MAG: thioredoxin domain-containing protein [Opitutales bacterium]
MPNRLIQEKSLYLQQHAKNPVEWYPWGPAALEAARAADKPLLISIGYSACHWCHVMAHECFEDAYIAGIMNKHFICVKVDREERPDVDQVYMEAVQMIQQHGGWPLNVFCLPDGRPFFGGTYFPSEDRGNGIIPWPQLLMRIADYYRRSRAELVENADAIQKNIIAGTEAVSADASADASAFGWEPGVLCRAAEGICGNHDDSYGGFGAAPKFPPSMALNFLRVLRRAAAVEADPALAKRIDEVCQATLRAMAHGGIYDQFGGGFARYSVDAHWLIPHFEKMLYDNALLVEAYTRGWIAEGAPLYAKIVEETVEWLEREMAAPCGGFYAALDADSEDGEGRYYVWTPEEVDAVLGPEVSRKLRQAYNITNEGNFEDGLTNPALVEPDFAVREELSEARTKLRAHREASRQAPGRDEKVSTFWNALMIRALADAGFYFGREGWLRRALEAAEFVWDRICAEDGEGGIRIHAVYYEGEGARIPGFLQDYASVADAFLVLASKIDWIAPGQSAVWQDRAKRCLEATLAKFVDPERPGCFFTEAGAETPVARRKEWFDNATPSGNSLLLHALSGLYALTGDARYAAERQRMLPVYADFAEKVASGVAHALEAAASDAIGLAVIKVKACADIEALRLALLNRPWRRCFIQVVADDTLPAAYQLCVGEQCLAPVDDPGQVTEHF